MVVIHLFRQKMEMKMNRPLTYLRMLCCLSFIFAVSIVYAQESEKSKEEEKQVSAADVDMDDGTGPAGDLIIPKRIAMHCGISSKEGRDKYKLNECLDKLAAEGKDLLNIEQEVMHQVSKDALEKALTTKSAAGNYEATRDEKLEEDNEVQSGSAAAGGEAAADGSDLRTKQTKNIKMSGRSSENLLQVIDIYSTRVGLDMMEAFFRYDAPYRLSEQNEEKD